MKPVIFVFFSILILSVACNSASESMVQEDLATAVASPPPGIEGGMGMGPNSSMRDRHHAPIPEEYISLTNPVASDTESLTRGAAVYIEHCLTCHGESGQGDGPTGMELDPAPAAIAHTSQMMNDAYLFYRVSEGGLSAPFNSAMPAWKDILDEQARWDVLNYVRALGRGQVESGPSDYDPEAEAAKHTEMVAAGVAQGLITQADGAIFLAVHDELGVLLSADKGDGRGGMDSRQEIFLKQLVEEGKITQAEADVFTAVHDTLLSAGLME